MNKKIALVGYVNKGFWPFEDRLSKEGFAVYRIHSVHSSTKHLLSKGVSPNLILDLSDTKVFPETADQAAHILSKYEQPDLPLFNNIILMDRLLRACDTDFALRYLAYCASEVEKFLINNNIEIISSGRDTALQMTVMLVAKKLDLTWACVTYTKLPKGRFGFSSSHVGDQFIEIDTITQTHREMAQSFLAEFRDSSSRMVNYYSSPTGWKDVLQKLPVHSQFFIRRICNNLIFDKGNSFAVASTMGLVRKFMLKKRNLAYFKYKLKYKKSLLRPYVFFGLHRQPESSVDVRGAFFSDQLTLIKQVARSIPATHDLCVKIHISDVDGQSPHFYRQISKIPGVIILSPFLNSMELIKKADLVITNAGAPGYEAGLLGKPAIAFSKAFWTELPGVYYISDVTKLPETVWAILDQSNALLPCQDEKIIDLLTRVIAFSEEARPTQTSDGKGLTEGDLNGLILMYHKLYTYHLSRRK